MSSRTGNEYAKVITTENDEVTENETPYKRQGETLDVRQDGPNHDGEIIINDGILDHGQGITLGGPQ